MSEILKEVKEEIDTKKEELTELRQEVSQEKSPEIKKGLMQRIDALEESLSLLNIKWRGFQEQVEREEIAKKEAREKHERQKEEAKKDKKVEEEIKEKIAEKEFFDD